MRQRHKPWADDFLEKNSHIVVANPINNKDKWKSIFKNENPIHVEIGTGKGQFLVGMAKQYPNVNFIGVELEKSIIVSAAQKVLASEEDNILLLNQNASHINEIFGENEISTVYLNFSDPWPKNRHEKRRLTFHTFLKQYRDMLDPSATLVLKTDNRGLFEYSLVSFSKFGMVLEEVSLDLHTLQDPSNVMTEYEQKFSEQGHPIYRCLARFV